jgi:hypothetical protein
MSRQHYGIVWVGREGCQLSKTQRRKTPQNAGQYTQLQFFASPTTLSEATILRAKLLRRRQTPATLNLANSPSLRGAKRGTVHSITILCIADNSVRGDRAQNAGQYTQLQFFASPTTLSEATVLRALIAFPPINARHPCRLCENPTSSKKKSPPCGRISPSTNEIGGKPIFAIHIQIHAAARQNGFLSSSAISKLYGDVRVLQRKVSENREI